MKGHGHDEKLIKYLRLQAVRARKWIIEMTYRAKSGHPGGSLSAVDAIVALYHHHMRHNPKNPKDPDRDRFILSKGHAAPALYAVLAQCGYFDEKELLKLRQVGAMLQGHPAVRTPGVEVATGSLGQGLSFGVGVALAGKLDKKDYHVYVLVGDGESEEGQIWEAASIASHYKLDNLIALLDRNELQIDGTTEEIYGLEPIEKRWEAFGWNVMKIDGHDFKQILDALDKACSLKNGKPTMIIMKTVKGKGISFMEGNLRFHGVAPNDEEYKMAMRELDEAEKRILEEGDGGED